MRKAVTHFPQYIPQPSVHQEEQMKSKVEFHLVAVLTVCSAKFGFLNLQSVSSVQDEPTQPQYKSGHDCGNVTRSSPSWSVDGSWCITLTIRISRPQTPIFLCVGADDKIWCRDIDIDIRIDI